MTMENVINRVQKSGYHSNLEEAVALKMWPTPRSSERAAKMTMENVLNRVQKSGYHSNLEEAVALKMWPTPTANEDAAGTPNGKMQRMLGNHPEVRNTGQGSLNPDWVEALMGYPKGWTSLDDGETDPGKTEFPE